MIAKKSVFEMLKNASGLLLKGYITVKHVYSDHAYNEMTLNTKHFGIPGKHSLYFFINFTLTAKLHITKSRL